MTEEHKERLLEKWREPSGSVCEQLRNRWYSVGRLLMCSLHALFTSKHISKCH